MNMFLHKVLLNRKVLICRERKRNLESFVEVTIVWQLSISLVNIFFLKGFLSQRLCFVKATDDGDYSSRSASCTTW